MSAVLMKFSFCSALLEMVNFLLGHGLNNGAGQRRKTSSLAMRLADLENSALRDFP
jgi:hypothetical protein